MSNILIDRLPMSVWVDECEYPVRWNFRTFLLIEELLEEEILSDEAKLNLALKLFYSEDNVPDNVYEAAHQLNLFYTGGASPEESETYKKGSGAKKVLSYTHDHERIFTAFLRSYGVNLSRTEDLHWYEFKAMFADLDEDTMLVKVIGYRTVNIGDIKDKKQQKFYRDMKRKYALPASKKAKEELKRIESVLLGDGDLTVR